MHEIQIGSRLLEKDCFNPPYFIAEAGVNHEGSIDKAKQMIEEVAKAGGNAIKFQAYKAETIASRNSNSYWDLSQEPTSSQFELFKKYDKFGKSEFEELAVLAKKYKIDFIATPFDIESADFLEPLVPFYKIASADITNKPLLQYIAKKGKLIVLSTGASDKSEIWAAIDWIRQVGNNKIVLLHCVLNYPTNYENANLGMISDMQKSFPEYVVGYSDHTLVGHANDVLITSSLLGAQIIEKHYTWNKTLRGNDHYHAFDYDDLKKFIDQCLFVKKLIGQCNKQSLLSEEPARLNARRSLVAKHFIPKGKKIAEEDITWKRPGLGIPPFFLENVVGGKALENILEDEILCFKKIQLADK